MLYLVGDGQNVVFQTLVGEAQVGNGKVQLTCTCDHKVSTLFPELQ